MIVAPTRKHHNNTLAFCSFLGGSCVYESCLVSIAKFTITHFLIKIEMDMLQIELNTFPAYLCNSLLQFHMLDLIVVPLSCPREFLVLFSDWIIRIGSCSDIIGSCGTKRLGGWPKSSPAPICTPAGCSKAG